MSLQIHPDGGATWETTPLAFLTVKLAALVSPPASMG